MRIFAFLLLFPILCHAEEWTPEDKAWQAAVISAYVVDWAQTRQITKTPGYYEQNPFLGEHPSIGRVNRHFAGMILLNTVIVDLLPRDCRRVFQAVTIVGEVGMIGHNYKIGLRAEF